MPTETRQSRRAVSARRKKATLYGARWDMTELIEADAMEQGKLSCGQKVSIQQLLPYFCQG